MRKSLSIHFAALLALAATSCGTEPAPQMPQPIQQDDGLPSGDATVKESSNMGRPVAPDKGYYDNMIQNEFLLMNQNGGSSSSANPVLFVNFDGALVERGYNAGQSFIICQDRADFEGIEISNSQREAALEKVATFFSEAGVSLAITDQEPWSGPFTTVHVVGSSEELGCHDGTDLGRSPFDPLNVNTNDIAFVYAASGENTHKLAVAIAHHAAVTFGLMETDNASTIMSAVYSADISGFGSGRTLHDQSQQDSAKKLIANLSGSADEKLSGSLALQSDVDGKTTALDIIAAIGKLLEDFDPDQPLDISDLLPILDKVIPGGLDSVDKIGGLYGLEDIIAVVMLVTEAAKQDLDQPSAEGDAVTSLIKVFLNPKNLQSQDLLNIASLAATIGIGAATGGVAGAVVAALDIILQGVGTVTSSSSTTLNASADDLPDFAALLSLDEVQNIPELITTLRGHTGIINNNYDGSTRQSLLTMIKVGYSQAYKALPAGY